MCLQSQPYTQNWGSPELSVNLNVQKNKIYIMYVSHRTKEIFI